LESVTFDLTETAEREEVNRLRRESSRPAEDVKILKRATPSLRWTPSERLQFIDAEQAGQHSVKRACRPACYVAQVDLSLRPTAVKHSEPDPQE
jgi:hypothetical protein